MADGNALLSSDASLSDSDLNKIFEPKKDCPYSGKTDNTVPLSDCFSSGLRMEC